MTMRHRRYWYALFLLVLSTPGFTQQIRVAAKFDNEPLSYTVNGEMKGIAFQVFSQICRDLDLPFTIQRVGPLPWKRALMYLQNNQVDVFLGADRSDEDLKPLVFSSKPLYQTSYSVFYRKQQPVNLQKLADTQGTVTEDLDLGLLRQQSGIRLDLDRSHTRQQSILKLMNRRVDYFIAPLLPTLNYLSEEKMTLIDQVAFLKKPIAVSENHLLYSPQTPLLNYKDKIDAKLADYHNSEVVDKKIGKAIARWKAFDWYLEHNH
ncbi:MAG: transporter substrate-binding domain-containing protein [Ketobacteraceae bacterium]|nr:transporter substrate-binding domain-containing protein [Ketobacteraceae bacterium]